MKNVELRMENGGRRIGSIAWLDPAVIAMKTRYFPDTDTLFIPLNDRSVVETRELNENLLIDLDEHDKVVSLTVEHAMEYSGKLDFSYETSAA